MSITGRRVSRWSPLKDRPRGSHNHAGRIRHQTQTDAEGTKLETTDEKQSKMEPVGMRKEGDTKTCCKEGVEWTV